MSSRVTASTDPTKITRNKRHSQVLNVSNQMGNRPGRKEHGPLVWID